MKSLIFPPFPAVDDAGRDIKACVSEVRWQTSDQDGDYELTFVDGALAPGRGWDPDVQPLLGFLDFEFEPSRLAMGELGRGCIVDPGATLGLYLSWECTSGRGRKDGGGVGPIETIVAQASMGRSRVRLSFEVPGGHAVGVVRVWPVIALIRGDLGGRADGVRRCASEPGSILGNLTALALSVTIDGAGGALRFEVFDGGHQDPLWQVKLEWEDPREHLVEDDAIVLRINRTHVLHEMLVGSSPDRPYQTPLMSEVTAAAMTLFFIKLRQDATTWHQIEADKELARGSVGELASYYLKTHSALRSATATPEGAAVFIRSIIATRWAIAVEST